MGFIMKKFIYLLLAIISTAFFSFASCTADTSDSSSSTSLSASSSTNSESDISTDSSSSQPQTFQATDADVDITSTVANDQLSVLIEVTPKYYIHDLKITVKFIFTEKAPYIHHENFNEELTPTRTKSFRVYLSESLIAQGEKIGIYEYQVSDGTYTADVKKFNDNFCYNSKSQTIDKTAFFCTLSFSISTSKQSVLLNILPYATLYNVRITVWFNLNSDHTRYIHMPPIEISQINELRIYSTLIYIPDTYIEQGILIDNIYVSVEGTHRIYPEIEIVPPSIKDNVSGWTDFY